MSTSVQLQRARAARAASSRAIAPKARSSRRWAALLEPELVLWALFLLITPFYVWKSGRPQPSDLLTIVIVPLLLRRGLPELPKGVRRGLIAISAFAAYAAVVNLLWGVLLLDHNVRKVGAVGFAAFYIFNAYIFALAVYLFLQFRGRFIVVTAWASVFAVILQLVLFAARGSSGGFREKLFFNNPNQLGYYALLVASLIAFGYTRARIPYWLAGIALAITTLLAALSLSKAAIIGTVAVACVAALRKPVLLIVTLVVLGLGTVARDPSGLVDKVVFRMNDLGSQGDDTLAGRGYSRIEAHPEYLVVGAGEVGHDRHGDFGGELHSSWATVLFSYGFIGILLLCNFFWHALKPVKLADMLFLVPIFWYGLTHQGLRFRLFWVFIAFVAVTSLQERWAAQRPRRSKSRPRLVGPSPSPPPLPLPSPSPGAP